MNALKNRHGTAVITTPSDREIVITRQFDAPAAAVFRAVSTPELVKRWWGFDASEWLVCEIDFRVGGRWRYVTRDEGQEMAVNGEYREIDAPRRIVSTEVFEMFPDAGALNTWTFDEKEGITTMIIRILHQTPENRDGHLQSGMESGMQIVFNRLEDLVVAEEPAV